jgi:hypothetical protein
MPEADPSTKRDFVVAELLNTEAAYIDDLELIIYDYKQPAESANVGVGPEFWDSVFNNVEDIHFTAYNLHKDLEVCVIRCTG